MTMPMDLLATEYGTRAQLYAHVCKFTQNQTCINRNQVDRKKVMVTDGFANGQRNQELAVEWKLAYSHDFGTW